MRADSPLSSTTSAQQPSADRQLPPLVLGNWKMHGSLTANRDLLISLTEALGQMPSSAPQCEVGVCVPFPYLAQVMAQLQGTAISLGAQDVSCHELGAYTGEVSAPMLQEFGCRWVLVGHSERREMHFESDVRVAQKAQAALNHGLTPVICVGESLSQREQGITQEVIHQQLQPVLALGRDSVAQLLIAYEPTWAIGTGLTATPEQANVVHQFIREELATVGAPQVRILYGGSVKADNAPSFFGMAHIDGVLVGGASLDAQEFAAIIAAACESSR